MTENQLKDKIAHLESVNDYLRAELTDLDTLMRSLGFVEGLKSIKETAKDVIFDREIQEGLDSKDN